MRSPLLLRLLGLAALLLAARPDAARAAAPPVSLPPVNLGGSSFLDGLGGPGLLTRLAFTGAHAPKLTGPDGGALEGRNRVSSLTAIAHVGYVAPWRILGGYVGAEVLLPFVLVDLDVEAGPAARSGGIGDLIVSPLVFQLPPLSLGGARLDHKVNLGLVLPTGRYRPDEAVNAGSNVVSLDPFYAFTIAWPGGLEASARLHHLWSSRNDAPAAAYGARSIQPGQAFHVNAAVSHPLGGAVRVGLAGYWLEQLTASRVGGRAQPGRERIAALGPGLLVAAAPLSVVANAYAELAARSRPVGGRLSLSFLRLW